MHLYNKKLTDHPLIFHKRLNLDTSSVKTKHQLAKQYVLS